MSTTIEIFRLIVEIIRRIPKLIATWLDRKLSDLEAFANQREILEREYEDHHAND